MKTIKQIEKYIDRAMCVDRPVLIRSVRKLKKDLREGMDYPEYKIRAEKLKKKAKNSFSKREKRARSQLDITYNPELPIVAKKDQIINALQNNKVVIISGATGSGKTTQIPKLCMEAGRGISGRIGCTQPRRIAAITVASRIAEELGQELGRSVGYKIRFDNRFMADPIIKIMTDGILLAETQNDPFLNEYDTIIVDEAHERSLNIDFILGILRNLIKKRRDLKLVITSATIDTDKFSKAFDMAPVIEVSGRMYPVEVRYASAELSNAQGSHSLDLKLNSASDSSRLQAAGDDQGYVEAAAEAVDLIFKESRYGDILIFMPSEQDIFDTIELIRGRDYNGVLVLPLFARLSSKEQSMVFSTGPGRKIIVSTNVAETSLTIPGIRYVVDSGLARIPSYSPRTRTTGLPIRAISKSSADQRKGRCGRVENGICIRLYDEADYDSRPLFTPPEILRSNLAEVILRMISLRLGDISSFPFIDSPSPKSIKDGFDTLIELGAIKKIKSRGSAQYKNPGRRHEKSINPYKDKANQYRKKYILTPKGKIMAGIPVDPKLSRILLEADHRGCLNEACVIVSALSIADPRQRPRDKSQQADQKHGVFNDPSSDFITLLNIWKAYRRNEKSLKTRSKMRKFCKDNFLSFKRMREWSDIHRQIMSVLKEHGIKGETRIKTQKGTQGLKAKQYDIGGPLYTALHKSFLCGYLANIARKKEKNIFNAAKGRKVVIFPGSALFGKAGTWIVAAEFVETSQVFARTTANIDPDWLEELGRDLCTYTWSLPHWEKNRGEVVANEQVSLFGLVIVQQRPVAYGRINPKEAGEIFIRDALVKADVAKKFPFMEHNQALIDELKDVEDKTRKRDILATEDDIFLFYQKQLEKDFYNFRSFAKYLKDKQDDSFLRMTIEDLQQKKINNGELAGFPDFLDTGTEKLKLEYDFKPGSEKDGVTVKIPAASAGLIHPHSIDRLVPGLFKEKITALIKNLPKKYRLKLVPASEKADIIEREMTNTDRPLFSQLSLFVKKRFNADVPQNVWSEKEIPDHLKMRISIRSSNDDEIAWSRDKSLLVDFSRDNTYLGDEFERKRKIIEKENIQSWDFGDISAPVLINEGKNFSYMAFSGLAKEGETLALRLFKSEKAAIKSHSEGIMVLYTLCFPDDFSALKKDFKSSECIQKFAPVFGGRKVFLRSLFQCLTRELFAVNIRNKKEFHEYGEKMLPDLYQRGQDFLKNVSALCEAFRKTLSCLEDISLKNRDRPQVMGLMEILEKELLSLVPQNFLDIYTQVKMADLKRYVSAIGIRAQRGAVHPFKDAEKTQLIEKYKKKFENMLSNLSSDASTEKVKAIEEFFWMIEEYKVSVFAQELKTPVKISPKRLDFMCSAIADMA